VPHHTTAASPRPVLSSICPLALLLCPVKSSKAGSATNVRRRATRVAAPALARWSLDFPGLTYGTEYSGRSMPCAHAGMPTLALACVSDARKMAFDCRVPLVLAEAETPGPGLPPATACTYEPRTRPPKQYCSTPRYGPRRSALDDGSQAGRHKKERARNATPTPTRVGMARIVVRDAGTERFSVYCST